MWMAYACKVYRQFSTSLKRRDVTARLQHQINPLSQASVLCEVRGFSYRTSVPFQMVVRCSFDIWERTTLQCDATYFLPEGTQRFAAYISTNCFTKYCYATIFINSTHPVSKSKNRTRHAF